MHWVYPRRVKVGLFIADLVIAILAMLASYGALSLRRISTWQMIVVSLLFALMFASFYYIFDLYDLSKRARIGIWYRFSAAVAMDVLAMCALLALLPGIFRGRAWVFAAIGLAGAASMILRVIYRVRSRDYVERFPAVIIGSAQDARALVACVPDESHLRFIGYFGESDRTTPMEIAGARNRASFPLHAAGLASCELDECGERAIVECRYLGRIEPDRVRKVVAAGAVQFLVVNSRFISAEVGALLTELRFRGVRIYSVPDFCMRLSEELPLELLSDEWLTFAGGFDLLESRMLRRLKRLSDLLLAAAAITLTLPLMVSDGDCGQARFAGTSTVFADPGGMERKRISAAEVPVDAAECRSQRRAMGATGRSPHDQAGQMDSQVPSGRASTVV